MMRTAPIAQLSRRHHLRRHAVRNRSHSWSPHSNRRRCADYRREQALGTPSRRLRVAKPVTPPGPAGDRSAINSLS